MEFLIIYAFLFVISSYGLYQFFIGAILKEPTQLSGSKMIAKIQKSNVSKGIWRKHPFIDLLQLVGKYIYVNPTTARTLEIQLSRTGLPYTPHEYEARKYCSVILGISFTIILSLLGSPIMIILGLFMTVWGYLKNKEELTDKINDMNESIMFELPQLVWAIEASMSGDRDLINILKRYIRISGKELKKELEILLMDMNTGNIQVALQKFDLRLNLVDVSRLSAILINIERGVDQSAALTYLAADISLMAREASRRELAKRPKRMKRAMLPAAVVAIITMFYVFIYSVVSTTSSIF